MKNFAVSLSCLILSASTWLRPAVRRLAVTALVVLMMIPAPVLADALDPYVDLPPIAWRSGPLFDIEGNPAFKKECWDQFAGNKFTSNNKEALRDGWPTFKRYCRYMEVDGGRFWLPHLTRGIPEGLMLKMGMPKPTIVSRLWAFRQAMEYFVDEDSGCSEGATDYDEGTRSCGSGSDTVYTTINGAYGAAGGGDIVTLREPTDGAYTEGLNDVIPNGSSGAPSILRGYSGESSIIDGITGSPSATENVIEIEVEPWITIDGLAANCPDGTAATCDGIIFLDTNMPDPPPGGGGLTRIGSRDGSDGESDNLTFAHMRITCANVTSSGFGSRAWSTTGKAGDNWLFDKVRITGCGDPMDNKDHCFYIKSANSTVQDSQADDCPGGHGVHWFDGSGALVNNIIQRSLAFNVGTSGFGFIGGSGNVGKSNVAYLCAQGGGLTGCYNNGYTNTWLYNTGHDSDAYCHWIRPSGVSHIVGMACPGLGIHESDGTLATNTDNMCEDQGANFATCDFEETDPTAVFTDPAARDYTVLSTMVDLYENGGDCFGGTVTTDFAGVARPQETNCEIGAYEWDVSDPAATITFDQPLEGFRYVWGQVVEIGWTTTLSSGNVDICIDPTGTGQSGVGWLLIATVLYSASPQNWTVNIGRGSVHVIGIEQDGTDGNCNFTGASDVVSGQFETVGDYVL